MGNSSINGNVENTRWSKNNPIKQKRDAAKGRFKKQQETDQENQQERSVNSCMELEVEDNKHGQYNNFYMTKKVIPPPKHYQIKNMASVMSILSF